MDRDYIIKIVGLLMIVLMGATGLFLEISKYNAYHYSRNSYMNEISSIPVYNKSGRFIQNSTNTNGMNMGSCMSGY